MGNDTTYSLEKDLQELETLLSTEGVGDSLIEFFSKFNNGLGDYLVKVVSNFATDAEVEYRAVVLSKANSNVRKKLTKLNYMDYKGELFPVIRSFDGNLKDFTEWSVTNIDAYKIIAHKSIDTLNALLVSLGTNSEHKEVAKAKAYFKNREKLLAKTKKSFSGFFTTVDSNVLELSKLLRNFKELNDVMSNIFKLSKELTSGDYVSLKQRTLDIKHSMDAAIFNNPDVNLDKDTKETILHAVKTTAETLEFLASITYASTSAIGTTESIVNYFTDLK